MKFIAPKKAKFLLCDDVRTEANRKLTIVGLYAGDRIVIVRGNQPPSGQKLPGGAVALLAQLSIACIVSGGKGEIMPNAKIIDPSGRERVTLPLNPVTLAPDQTTTIVLQGPGFLVPEFGTYSVEIELGSKAFEYKFGIIEG